MKNLLITIFILTSLRVWSQEEKQDLKLYLGTVFNQSSQEWNNTTGVGLFVEGNYFVNDLNQNLFHG